jgi:hypothetical protein
MKKSYLLIFLILSVGCAQNKIEDTMYVSFNDFGNPIELKGEILPTETLWKPISIFFSDSVFLVVDNSYGDYFVLIYDKELNQIAEQVPKGIGPNESLICWNLQIIESNIWAFDPQTNQMKAYLKDDFLTKSHIIPHNTVTFKEQHITMATLSNMNFIGYNITSDNILDSYDPTGIKNKNIFASYPKLSEGGNKTNMEKNLLFNNRVFYCEKHKKIVVLYIYTDLIEIYDEGLNLISRIHGPDRFIPTLTYDGGPTRETRLAYQVGRHTSDEIWALYDGDLFPRDSHPKYPNKMLVFDFFGKPLRFYNLEYPLHSFCIDEENRIIYGLAEIEDYCIVKYHY